MSGVLEHSVEGLWLSVRGNPESKKEKTLNDRHRQQTRQRRRMSLLVGLLSITALCRLLFL